jgi:Zn-dependent protease with chaperone function
MLLTAVSFDALFERNYLGFLGVAVAFLIRWLANSAIRTQTYGRPRIVKSGDLYKRACVVAKKAGIDLKAICVMPAGHGRIINAHAGKYVIAVSETYAQWLKGQELDFVIAHELSHVRRQDWKTKLQISTGFPAGLAVACFAYHPSSLLSLSAVRFVIVILPIVVNNLVSQQIEFQADCEALKFVPSPETAIQALARLHRATGAPITLNWITEPFQSHPAFSRRVASIASVSGMQKSQTAMFVTAAAPDAGGQH